MIDLEMIDKIEEWGFEIEREYHLTKAHDGIVEINPVNVCDYKIYTKYKLYHDDAIELTTFSDFLGDEFEEYLKDNDIQLYDYDNSDIEEFFEQYGIEVY